MDRTPALSPESDVSLWRRLAGWLPGLVIMAGVAFAVLHFGNIKRFTTLIVQIHIPWVLLAAASETTTYLCMAAVWYLALRHSGHHRSLVEIMPLGVAKLFADLAVPSGGLSGALLVVRAFSRRAISSATTMAALLIELLSYYTAYLVAVFASLAILAAHEAAHPALLAVAALFSAMAVGIPASILWVRRRPQMGLLAIARRVPGVAFLLEAIAEAPSRAFTCPALIAQTVLLQGFILLLHAFTLWVMLLALDEPVSFLVAFSSFVMASVVAMLGPIPLGLGTFEGACVLMLNLLGSSLEAGRAATLLARGLMFWLPMIPGLWVAHRELR